MSNNKRCHSLDKATRDDAEPRHQFLRKKPRLSPVKNLKRDGKFLKSRVMEDDDSRHTSDPAQLLRPHHQLDAISAQARPFSSIKHRPTKTFTPFSPNSAPYSGPPELFDVPPGLPDVIPPAEGELSPWEAGHAAFIRSAAGLSESHWIGMRPLGSGGFGTAGLWERRNENNAVIEVM